MKKYLFLSLMTLIFSLAWSSGIDLAKIKKYRDLALQNNLEIQIEKRKLEASNAKSYQSASNFLPSVNLSARLTNNDKKVAIPLTDSISIVMQNKKNTATQIEATQVLFSPAVMFNYLMQKNLTKSDDYGYQSKISNLEFNVLDAYFNCMKAFEMLEMRKTSLDLAKESNYVTEKLYKVDKVPETDLLRAQVNLMTGEQEIANAENQLSLAKNYFNSLLNRDMNAEIEMDHIAPDYLLKLSIKDELATFDTLNLLINHALENRMEIKQMFAGYQSTKYAKQIMLSDFLPSLIMTGNYGYSGTDFNYKESEKSWSVSGILSWNLFSGFNSSAKAYEVNSQVKQMEKTYTNTKHLIELEVRNCYLDYYHKINQFEVAQRYYQTSLSNYNMVKKQYENELAPMINLIDSKNLLDASKANLIVSYFDVLLTQAKLDKSIGNPIIK